MIEKVKHYRYLGVMINASGSFSDAKDELYKRGLKDLFKMYKCFEGHKPKIRVTGLQVWSKISKRSLINSLNRLWLRLTLDEHKCWKKMNQLHLICRFLHIILFFDTCF
jgi:hypothetical protein